MRQIQDTPLLAWSRMVGYIAPNIRLPMLFIVVGLLVLNTHTHAKRQNTLTHTHTHKRQLFSSDQIKSSLFQIDRSLYRESTNTIYSTLLYSILLSQQFNNTNVLLLLLLLLLLCELILLVAVETIISITMLSSSSLHVNNSSGQQCQQ